MDNPIPGPDGRSVADPPSPFHADVRLGGWQVFLEQFELVGLDIAPVDRVEVFAAQGGQQGEGGYPGLFRVGIRVFDQAHLVNVQIKVPTDALGQFLGAIHRRAALTGIGDQDEKRAHGNHVGLSPGGVDNFEPVGAGPPADGSAFGFPFAAPFVDAVEKDHRLDSISCILLKKNPQTA